jgi:hypothetical protein
METPLLPHLRNLDVPAQLSDVIMRLLEKDPADRGTAQDVVDALARIEKGEPLPARKRRSISPPAPSTEKDTADWHEVTKNPPVRKTQARPFPWWIVAVAAGAALFCLLVPVLVAAIWLFR